MPDTLALNARSWTNLREVVLIGGFLSRQMPLASPPQLFLLPAGPANPSFTWPRALSLTWRVHLASTHYASIPINHHPAPPSIDLFTAAVDVLRTILDNSSLPGPGLNQPVPISVHLAILNSTLNEALFGGPAYEADFAQLIRTEINMAIENLGAAANKMAVHVHWLNGGDGDLMEEAMMPDERWEESSDLSSTSSGDDSSEDEPVEWSWDDFMEGEDEPEEDLEADPDYEPASDSEASDSVIHVDT